MNKIDNNFRINEQLSSLEKIRLVGDNVNSGIYSFNDAISIALEQGLDLVEITKSDNISICKIIDFQKFLYQKKKKEKNIKNHSVKIEIKELKFSPNIGEHDYNFKLKHAQTFLREGNRIRAFIIFNGREFAFINKGKEIFNRLIQDLQDVGIIDGQIKLEGKKLTINIIPRK